MQLARGTTLGRYRIVDALRAGGMATLYLARRTGAAGFSKPVAIKVVREHLSEDQRFIEMFVSEAKLAAQVDDPHVAHTEELGHENDIYFIAMEYVLGGSLAQITAGLRKQARALAPSIATRIVADAARGLHAIHEATSESGEPLHIVHRDVSPQNILVSTKGIVKIIDLGVARARGARRNDSGSLTGKVAYMSPEQARGESVDRRTDVYALATVLWELLTGRRLFRAESDVELLNQVRDPRIDPPSRWSLGVISPALEGVIMRALAPERSARPATAEAFCEELLAADPEARRIATSELGGIVEQTLKEKLTAERRLLREGSDGEEHVHSEPVLGDDVLATRTVPLTVAGEDEATPHSDEAAMIAATSAVLAGESRGSTKSRWSLVAAGLIVALGIGIAIVFRPPAAQEAASDAANKASPPARAPSGPIVTASPPPAETVLEIVEAPAAAPVAPTASTVASAPAPARTKRRGRPPSPAPTPSVAPAPAPAPPPAPTGNTTIVHGTPLTTDLH